MYFATYITSRKLMLALSRSRVQLRRSLRQVALGRSLVLPFATTLKLNLDEAVVLEHNLILGLSVAQLSQLL